MRVTYPEKVSIGPINFNPGLADLGCLGVIIALVVIVVASIAFWSWLLMVLIGAAGVPWGFWHVVAPYGIIAALVLSRNENK